MEDQKANERIDRRRFLSSTAATGAGLAFSPMVFGQTGADKKPDDINVALLGVGEQGQVLTSACLKIPGIRIKAVCDIWEKYNRKRVSRMLKAYRHEHNTYIDHKEMLNKEKDIDAVIIATPDCWHARHTVDCLNAGLHVYCEKEMSNTLGGAKRMVLAAQKTGKLLQIGHQRRSNPRYVHCYEHLIKGARLLGRITAVNGQWNRRPSEPLGWPKNAPIDQAILQKYGYTSMEQFKNWRWYKGLGGGPMVDLGSHQIDIYNWFLDAHPQSVIASGRTNYYDPKTHEWPDTVMAIYEYETAQGSTSAYYQTISSNGSEGYFEKFMGDQGTLTISEASNRGIIYPEPRNMDAENWMKCLKKGHLIASEEIMKAINRLTPAQFAASFGVDETLRLEQFSPKAPKKSGRSGLILPVKLDKPIHQPHLENFFDAIRGKAKLTCPAEIGYETAVAVLKVNEAIEAGRKLKFQADEFEV